MGLSKKLKICKVQSTNFAKYCLKRGVDYLGIHVIDYSLDPLKRDVFKYIADLGGKAILVTKEKDLKRLVSLQKYYKPWAIQLHYSITAYQYKRLRANLDTRLIPVFTDATDIKTIVNLLKISEIAVYDTSFIGGTNETHPVNHVANIPDALKAKVLLAGGVSPDLIANDVGGLGGYDVQSYCTSKSGHSFCKAKKLIDCVKLSPKRDIAVSLTDISNASETPNYRDSLCLEYQLDYSTGSLYKEYITDTNKIDNIIKTIDAPFALHIFANSIKEYQKIIDYYVGMVPNKIIRFYIQYSQGLEIDKINTYESAKCPSIYYKDIDTYLNLNNNPYNCVSIILPTTLNKSMIFLKENKALLLQIANEEIWFDKKIDNNKIVGILATYDQANFIIGSYILKNWDNEKLLYGILNVKD